MNPKIFPVIHHLNEMVTLDEVDAAVSCGADGVFLISHRGADLELLEVGVAAKRKHPGFPVGINLLSMGALEAAREAVALAYPMFWGDDVGVDSTGVNATGVSLQTLRNGNPGFQVFASVSFKYRPPEPNPAEAARVAFRAGFVPTTSGSWTGSAPDIDKIKVMSAATGGVLALASGMTPYNISQYAPYASHILVATGVAQDAYRMDRDKLRLLIANAK